MCLEGCQGDPHPVTLDPELTRCSCWNLRLAIQARPPPDGRNIASGSYENHNIVGDTLSFVILFQFCPESPRLSPYDRVLARVKVRLAPIGFGSNGVFLEVFFEFVMCLLYNKSEEP